MPSPHPVRPRSRRVRAVVAGVGLVVAVVAATAGAWSGPHDGSYRTVAGPSVADLWLAAHRPQLDAVSEALGAPLELVDASPGTPRVAWPVADTPSLDDACRGVQRALPRPTWRAASCSAGWEDGGRPAARRDAGTFEVGTTPFAVALTLVVTDTTAGRRAVLGVDATPIAG